VSIDRTNWTALIDDDGSNLVGTPWLKNTVKTVLLDPIDAAFTDRPGSTAPVTTGTITAEPIPTGTGDLVTYHNNATLKTIQGMVAGLAGQRWTHVSKGAGQVDFAHLHTSGTPLGKLKLFAASGVTSLSPGVGVSVFQYDAIVTQWRLVTAEQGAWITPATPTFTGSGTLTFTSVTVGSLRYRLSGRTLLFEFDLTGTIGGAGTTIQFPLPVGFTAAGLFGSYVNNFLTMALWQTTTASQTLVLYKDVTSGGNFTTGSARLLFNGTIEIQ
jgi:hypothetical protein